MLKTHQRSNVNCNGKLKPLHKRESGYMYCLSPTDPPVPLRAVPKGNSQLQHDSLRFHRPNKLQLGHRAGTRDVSTSGSASLKSAGSCGGNFSAASKGPCSPIYEVLELPGRASSIQASAVPAANEDAPTLPRRGPLRRANKMSNNVKPNPNGVSESQTMPQNARSTNISGSTELDVETERKQEDTECVTRGEEEGEQSEMASGAKMEREQKRQSKLQDEDKKRDVPIDDLDVPLYSKVKKPKKCGAIVVQNSRAAEKERPGKVQLEGDLLGPPSVPPYSEGHCSFTVEEGAENDIITRMKHDDRGSGDQTGIPLYSVVKKNKEMATKVCDSPM